MKSNVTLYMNRDKTKVVPEGSPEAAFLLVRAGKEMSEAQMDVYGAGVGAMAKEAIKGQKEAPAPEAEPAPESEAPAETKAADEGENKAVKAAPENKGKKD